ncbi:sigma-54 interaction domain-containing protein [Thioclava sp. FR2]|uniref:sigma-54 interaction domain-containing protein n=1 Tax=Thioclava sp. FR2 TaxID=3445780 RepID=UPI003EB9A4DF
MSGVKMTTHWKLNGAAARPLPLSDALVDQLIVGKSPAMVSVKKLIATVAVSDAPVMVLGATGAGKELVAEALHKASGRSGKLIAVNCAAIPSELLESELFGHEKGSFTGADRQKIGLIEQANGGTLFLDEIGDMPAQLQSKLLRVLESRKVQRVGASTQQAVDFRLVTATHRDLEKRVEEGSFRADLYFRISVFPVMLPSLSERPSDIPLILARMISDRMAANPALDAPHFDESGLRALAAYSWPGNVRELRNILTRAFVLFPGQIVGAQEVRENLLTLKMPGATAAGEPKAPPVKEAGLPDPSKFQEILAGKAALDLRCYLRDIEVALIEAALQKNDSSVTQTADTLRLRRTTLIEKMKKYGIKRDELV